MSWHRWTAYLWTARSASRRPRLAERVAHLGAAAVLFAAGQCIAQEPFASEPSEKWADTLAHDTPPLLSPSTPSIFQSPPCPILPPMIGDFFSGSGTSVSRTRELDRLFIAVDDLDAPLILPPGSQPLTITEPGPVGVFRSSLNSAQDIQAALRGGVALPPATLVTTVNADATLTTAESIAQIRSQLASTPGVGFDLIPLAGPPGSYQSAVDAAFRGLNGPGQTVFDAAASGAFLQGGIDTLDGGEDLDAFYFFTYVLQIDVATPSAGSGGAGRAKIAENGTTVPVDRVYVDYSGLGNTAFATGGVNVHRVTPGIEKTFLDGQASLELRLPFATTVDSDIFAGGATNTETAQIGNLTLYLKLLLYTTETWGLSGGLGTAFPTADDLTVSYANGGRLVEIDNDAFHLQPFLGAYFAPDDRLFTQGFVQFDFDANGNRVALNSTGAGLQDAGRLNDSAFLFLDWSLGYWLLRPTPNSPIGLDTFHPESATITRDGLGVAPTVELHYARSLQDSDTVSAGGFRVGNFGDDVETLNLVLGTHLAIGRRANFAVGYVAPLMDDDTFDDGVRVMLNYFP